MKSQVAVLAMPGLGGPSCHGWMVTLENQQKCRLVHQHDWLQPLRGDWMIQLQEAVLMQKRCHLLAAGLSAHLIGAWLQVTNMVERVASVAIIDPIELTTNQSSPFLKSWGPQPPQKWPVPMRVFWKDHHNVSGITHASVESLWEELVKFWKATNHGN